MLDNKWARLLAYVTGLVNQRLLLQCEYLVAENRILRSHLSAKLRLSDPERSTLAEIGKRLGRKYLAEVALVAKPETILAWYRRLIARKFDGYQNRSYPGRPRLRCCGGGTDRPPGPTELQLGIRSDRGCPGQPRPSRHRPDHWKHPEAARYHPGAQAQPDYDLEGLYFGSPGSPCWRGFLHS